MVKIHHGSLERVNSQLYVGTVLVSKGSIPTECLVWSGGYKEMRINVVEVCEIGVDLQNPVGLHQNDCADVYSARCSA